MTGRIFRSIFVVAMSLLLAGFVVFLGVLYQYFTGLEEKQLDTVLQLSAEGVEQNGMAYLEEVQDDCRLTWVDKDGSVLFDSESEASEMENHSEREEIKEAFTTGYGSSVRYSSTLTQRTIYRAAKLSDNTVLRVSIQQATVLLLLFSMLQPMAAIALLALILSFLLARRLSEKIIKPLEQFDLENLPEKAPYEELTPFLKKMRWQKLEIQRQKQALNDKRLSMEFAEENRREFTANVSHELKTPLQSIMGSAELIENNLVQPEDLPSFGGKIRKEAERLLTLIQDIIHLSRLDEGNGLSLEETDLYAIAKEETEILQPVAEEHGIELSFTGEPVVIHAVPQLLHEIVHNLCDNAIKYNSPGGKVSVRIVQSENSIVLSVSDTGIGIAPEQQDRVFERFYRVDKSHSRATGGTGLGLSIVKHAASYMNAELSMESALGVGTTITLQFKKNRPQSEDHSLKSEDKLPEPSDFT